MTKAPNRWLAALLSLFIPGTGQLYAGDPKRACAFFGAFMIAVPVGWYGVVLISGLSGLLVNAILMLGVGIAAAMSAWRIASQWVAGSSRATWSRWFVVLPLFVIVAVFYARLNGMRKAYLVEAFSVPSGSMAPTVLAGDDIIVGRRRRAARTPVRGAVVVHRKQLAMPWTHGAAACRRVGARHHRDAPGHSLVEWGLRERTVCCAGRNTVRCGQQLQREMRRWQLPHLVRDSTGYLPTVIRLGTARRARPTSFFTLGDNRDDFV